MWHDQVGGQPARYGHLPVEAGRWSVTWSGKWIAYKIWPLTCGGRQVKCDMIRQVDSLHDKATYLRRQAGEVWHDQAVERISWPVGDVTRTFTLKMFFKCGLEQWLKKVSECARLFFFFLSEVRIWSLYQGRQAGEMWHDQAHGMPAIFRYDHYTQGGRQMDCDLIRPTESLPDVTWSLYLRRQAGGKPAMYGWSLNWGGRQVKCDMIRQMKCPFKMWHYDFTWGGRQVESLQGVMNLVSSTLENFDGLHSLASAPTRNT